MSATSNWPSLSAVDQPFEVREAVDVREARNDDQTDRMSIQRMLRNSTRRILIAFRFTEDSRNVSIRVGKFDDAPVCIEHRHEIQKVTANV